MFVGNTGYETPVWVNKSAYECDLRVTVGKVELHEFMGFSGGRKSIMPGICGEKTILTNHRPEMFLNPNAIAGVLEGNPMHDDAMQAANKLGVDFSVNFVMRDSTSVAAVFAGGLEACHAAAVEAAKPYCTIDMPIADIIVTTPGSPLNCELYQAVKAVFALKPVIHEHTIVALYAACPDGVNSPDMLYPFTLFQNLDEVEAYARANFKVQMDHVLPMIELLRLGMRLFCYSPNVSASELESLRIIPTVSPQAMMNEAIKSSGLSKPRIVFFPEPQRVIIKTGSLH